METIYDILREMRDRNEVRKVRLRQYGGVHCNCSIMPDDLPKVYADRIEKAAKLIVKDGVPLDEFNKVIAERNELEELNRKCCDENERLWAALQPVLDCDVTKESYLAQSEVVWIAQRIWNEGVSNENK